MKKSRCAGVLRDKDLPHVRTDLEGLRPDARPQPGQRARSKPGCSRAARWPDGAHAERLKVAKIVLQNARRKAAPAGMGCRYPGSLAVSEQHGQAVGNAHSAHHGRLDSDASVGLDRRHRVTFRRSP